MPHDVMKNKQKYHPQSENNKIKLVNDVVQGQQQETPSRSLINSYQADKPSRCKQRRPVTELNLFGESGRWNLES